jgi:hypothetical protein
MTADDGIPEYVDQLPLLDVREEYDEFADPKRVVREAVALQSTFGDSKLEARYDDRHGIASKHWLTILRPEDATWIVGRLGDRLVGKTVVEIGAGMGVLAVEMARVAKRVFAIEADPKWGLAFVRYMYRDKPTNLTWILDRAQNVVDLIRTDLAVVVTGSDEVNLRELAGRFAPDVAMPWQDWNGGKAIVKGWGPW